MKVQPSFQVWKNKLNRNNIVNFDVNTNRELKKASLGGINEHMWADYLEACEELHTFNKEREQTEEALVASQQPEYEDPKNFLIPEALLPQAPGKRHKKAFVASQPSRNRSQLIQKEAEKMNFQPVPDQDGEILQNLDQRLHQLEVAGSSKKVPICYLCQRKFKSFGTLHQHEQYSVLHLANLAKGVQGS